MAALFTMPRLAFGYPCSDGKELDELELVQVLGAVLQYWPCAS